MTEINVNGNGTRQFQSLNRSRCWWRVVFWRFGGLAVLDHSVPLFRFVEAGFHVLIGNSLAVNHFDGVANRGA